MNTFTKKLTFAVGSSVAALCLAVPALAMDDHKGKKKQAMGDNPTVTWAEERENAVPASEVLRGDYVNGLRPVGQVDHLVLNKEADAVKYVIVDSTGAFDYYVDSGFYSYNAVDLESSASLSAVNVRVDGDEQIRGPEEIEITETEAPYRLVGSILDNRIAFENGKTHEIDDMLIRPKNGEVVAFLINEDDNMLFDDDQIAISAEDVTFKNGMFRADVPYRQVASY